MDPVSDGVSIVPPEVRSDGLEASVGEKRPLENGEDCELGVPSPKKARGDGVLTGNVKKVAEIVLVLATTGKMRAGRNPTAAEIDMMAEAREKLAEVCQGFAPKEVFPMDSFGAVIEDLGLNKVKEPKLGFRPPKMSIAEKLLLTKRKMEKSEEFSLHSAPYSPQRLQTNLGAAAESRGTSHAVRTFPTDKPGHAPGGIQPASPLGHVSAVKSTSLPYQLPTSEVRPTVSSGLPSSHLGRDSSSQASARVERPHFRLDGRLNGSSYTPQVQANSSGDHTTVKTPTWSVQPQSTSSAKTGLDNKLPAQNSIKVAGAGAADMSRSQAATSKPFITQTTSGNPPSIHQHLQGRNFVQAPSLCNSHIEIGKIIQKLLQPQLPQRPEWTPPSRDYMNKAVTCQMCKLTINEVESVLVCDACEKAYHLKCLQCNSPKAIPRGEWHCGKCLALSNGKPLPPKYGRVMRNVTASKVSSNASPVPSLSVKKVGTSEEKVNQQRIAVNGNSELQSAPNCNMGINYSNSTFGLKKADAREMQGNDIPSTKGDIDGKPPGTCPSNLVKSSEAACVSPVELSVDHSCEEKLVTESKSQHHEKYDTAVNSFGHSQAHGNPQTINRTGLPNSAEILSKPWHDAKLMVKESEKSSSGETLDCSPSHGIEQDKQGVTRANPVETSGATVGARENGRSSSNCLHDVDWIGNIFQIVDEKTYYKSCCINGVVYKVHDHALFRSNDKLMPSKLQAMWEDTKTRSKWVVVNRCYLPADLPGGVGRPCAPESNEVYDSNHESTMMANLIEGPCEVLHPNSYSKENERRSHLGPGASDELRPLFLCKWFYDESKGLFRDVSC